MTSIDNYLIKPGDRVRLSDIPSEVDGGLSKQEGKRQFALLSERLIDLQRLFAAEAKHSLLLVFQAMDAAGKDSTIREVIGPLNPAGVHVVGFKKPTPEEMAHDYLWRVHQHTPARGTISVFNRSHYEDVLVVRVHQLVPQARWKKRYEHIRAFEQLLADEGTTVIKFYLHISKDYQKQRLQRRLDRPDKHWKFNMGDLPERERWAEYRGAFEDAIQQTSTQDAPWYVIPSERRWYRNLLIAGILVDQLERFEMAYPEPDFDPSEIVIPD